ncbi:MAG: ABC transporter permease [Planctomycetaceae bacterium]
MNIWNIAAKDLLLLVRDRRALVVLVALPLVFIAIIGMSTGKMLGWRNSNESLRLAVVDQSVHAAAPAADNERTVKHAADDGEETNDNTRRLSIDELVPEILKRMEERKGIQVTKVATIEAARNLMSDEHYTAAVVIGPKFTELVDAMAPGDVFNTRGSGLASDLGAVDIQVETEEPPSNGSSLARLVLHNEVFGAVAPYVLWKSTPIRKAIRASERRQDAGESEESATDPKSVELSGSFGSVVYQKVVPTYTVMFAFFLVTLMSRSFLTERELGTFRRLQTTPVSSSSLILGKVLPYFLISLIQSALLFLFGKILFGMSWGEKPWLLFPVVFATSAAATGLGMLIATVVRTEAQVTSVAMMVILAMAGISGCFTPRDWLPDAMRTLSLATPHAWALIAYDQILNTRVPNLGQVWQCCGWLWLFAAGYFFVGLWRFRSMPS